MTLFPISINGKALMTPGKHPLAVPTRALADAIAAEWQAHKKFSPHAMPLTALAYTAIDRIAGQENNIIEALLVYIDTDTLSYRSSSPSPVRGEGRGGGLGQCQNDQWNPILAWADKTFGATWAVTTGVMPLEQPQALHKAIGKYLKTQGAMQLSAACLLASGFSSLALALAVLENHINAAEAFRLSRLEEESQAEQWGRDEEADRRAQSLKDEVLTAERFLGLLKTP